MNNYQFDQYNTRQATISDLNNKFRRLIYQLGNNNSSGIVVENGIPKRPLDAQGNPAQPSMRYTFEVDFAYALNELANVSNYIFPKYVELTNILITDLINAIKQKSEVENG